MMRNGKHQSILKSELMDWCSMVIGKAKINIFIKISMESMKKVSPNFFHRCPYQGLHEAMNISFPRQLMVIYPNGNFGLKFSMFDGVNKILSFQDNYTLI
jgi:Protein of unknown function (DUF1091)